MRTNEEGDKTRRRSLSRLVSIIGRINHKKKEEKTNETRGAKGVFLYAK